MTSPDDLSREEKQAALDSVLATGFVKEQTHLRALLEYLGRRAIAEGSQPIKEYTIGIEALGKADDYDPRIDPTVRVGIGRLRTKLAEHYDSPAATGAVRIDIPKGQYQLVFAPRRQTAPAPDVPPLRGRLAQGLAVLLVGFMLGVLAHAILPSGGTARPGNLAAELQVFWQPHLDSNRPTTVVYGTPLLIKLDRWLLRDSRVNRWEDLPKAEGLDALVGAVTSAVPEAAYDFTGVGEAEAVFAVTKLLAARGTSLAVKRSSTLSWDDFKDTNVVLVGSHKFNQKLAELPFELKYMSMSRPSRVVNMRPAAGEPAEYATIFVPGKDTPTEEYAVVSSLPGVSPGTHLTVVSGPSSEGTAAAAEFITRADTLRRLYEKMGGGPLSLDPLPPAFQVVVRARMKDGIVMQLEYVTHHVLGR
jgi:hypothetical protein